MKIVKPREAVTGDGRPSLRLHILGSGTPTPSPDRFGSSFVVGYGEDLIMVDCGPAATHKLVKVGLWPLDVGHLFFTHHHFDHDVDYPCLLLCRWDQSIGREPELQVYGPAPTAELTERLIGEDGVFAHDWRARVGHPASQAVFVNRGGVLPRKPPKVGVRDIGVGDTVGTGRWTMRTGVAQHAQPFLDSLAYRLETDLGSIVFTGDTQPCAEIVELARGADVLICMCWDIQEAMEAGGETIGTCGTRGAAEMAAAAGVGTLIVTHTGPNISRPGGREHAVVDVARAFEGDVFFADELMSLTFR